MTKANVDGQGKRPSRFMIKLNENINSVELDPRQYTFKPFRVSRKTAVLFSALMTTLAKKPEDAVAIVLQSLLDRFVTEKDKKVIFSAPEEDINQCLALLFKEVTAKREPGIVGAKSTNSASSPAQADR